MNDNVNPFSTEPVPTLSPSPSSPSPTLSRTNSQASSAQRSSTAVSASPPPTQRASFPDPSKEPRKGASRLAGPKPKEDFCCERDRQIARGDDISIVDAFKTTEGGKSSYITYVIRLGSHTTHRRYSAFLSLHQALQGLYPVLIIPPIPSKQNITDYAIKGQSKTKEDSATITKRKRLLEDFLRRIVRHPILGGEHIFHRFLEDDVSWTEVVHSPPISLLPKNPLHAPSHNPTFQDADEQGDSSSSTSYIAHHLLPNPSPSHPVRRPDQRFLESEIFTDKFQQHFQNNMEKVNRRTAKRWGERATDMSELGAQWNGFSLTESGELGNAIEKVGQAVDADYLATTQMINGWEVNATEPLHIYAQFAQLIRSRLSFRHQKHVQYELVQEALDHQRDKLELLEAAERESRRLDDALERGAVVNDSTAAPAEPDAAPSTTGSDVPPSQRTAARRSAQSFGLLSAVKHSLSGMMDVDPEATRRANIGKTRDNISQLEDSLQASAQDLKYASTTLQADLDRFQRQKVADLRQLAIELSTLHREWCRHNLEAWKAAQAAVREIPDHPNHPIPSDTPQRTSQDLPDLAASMDRDLPPVPDSSISVSTTPTPMAMGGTNATRQSNEFESSDPLGSEIPTSPFKSEPSDPISDLESKVAKVDISASAPVGSTPVTPTMRTSSLNASPVNKTFPGSPTKSVEPETKEATETTKPVNRKPESPSKSTSTLPLGPL